MKGFRIIYCVVCICFLFSCNKGLTVGDFLKQVSQDKDYKKELSIGDFNLKCEYRPSELICLAELTKGQADYKFDQKQFNEELKKYENGCYMDLTFQLKSGKNVMMEGINNPTKYAARIGELTYSLTKDCYMILNNRDTVKAITCNFSNTYGNSPDVKVLLVFPKKKIANAINNIEVVYADKTFGIADKAVFTYGIDDINKKIPTIIEQK